MEETVTMFAGLEIPYAYYVAWATALIEFLGGALLVLGLFTREAALGCAAIMVGAIWTVHYPNGFFLKDGGYEYCALLLSVCVCLLFSGAGVISLDRIVFPNNRWTFVKDPASIKLEPPTDTSY